MAKRKREGPISLAHLSFEEAVTALVQDDAPTHRDSQVGESGSTTEADPESETSEQQTAQDRTSSAD